MHFCGHPSKRCLLPRWSKEKIVLEKSDSPQKLIEDIDITNINQQDGSQHLMQNAWSTLYKGLLNQQSQEGKLFKQNLHIRLNKM